MELTRNTSEFPTNVVRWVQDKPSAFRKYFKNCTFFLKKMLCDSSELHGLVLYSSTFYFFINLFTLFNLIELKINSILYENFLYSTNI